MKWELSLILVFAVFVFRTPSNVQETSSIFSVNSIAYSPDGRQIAVGGGAYQCNNDPAKASDYAIRILDAQKNQSLFTLDGYTCDVTSVAWSPDGTKLASTSHDGSLRIWDTVSWKELGNYGSEAESSENQIVWSPDGKLIASSSGNKATVRDANTGQIIKFLNDNDFTSVTHIAWKPDGGIIALSTFAEHNDTDQTTIHNIELWDITSSDLDGKLLRKFDMNAISSLNWSHDDSRLAGGGTDDKIRIIDAVTGEILAVLAGNVGGYGEISWSPNDTWIASGGADNTLRVWDVQTGEELAAFDYDGMFLTTVAWSPDGSHIAYSGFNPDPEHLITIVDMATVKGTPNGEN
jgi:WD40 repeat protein